MGKLTSHVFTHGWMSDLILYLFDQENQSFDQAKIVHFQRRLRRIFTDRVRSGRAWCRARPGGVAKP